jgi:hypothetical protein
VDLAAFRGVVATRTHVSASTCISSCCSRWKIDVGLSTGARAPTQQVSEIAGLVDVGALLVHLSDHHPGVQLLFEDGARLTRSG